MGKKIEELAEVRNIKLAEEITHSLCIGKETIQSRVYDRKTGEVVSSLKMLKPKWAELTDDEVPVFITNMPLKKGAEGKRKLTDRQALEIYKSNLCAKALSIEYSINPSTIYRIKNNLAYKSSLKKDT